MKKINWPDQIVSLMVVILGISIAFFLENRRQNASLEKQESEYTAGLIEDLSYNAVYLDTLLHYNELVKIATSALTDATLGRPIANDSILAEYVRLIQLPVVFLPQHTSYESLKSSGQMTLISDFDVRNKLISLHEYHYSGAKVFDQAVAEHVRDYVKPYMMKNLRYTSFSTVNNSFLQDDYFRKIIFQYKFTHEAKTNFYNNVKNQTDELLAELESLQ